MEKLLDVALAAKRPFIVHALSHDPSAVGHPQAPVAWLPLAFIEHHMHPLVSTNGLFGWDVCLRIGLH